MRRLDIGVVIFCLSWLVFWSVSAVWFAAGFMATDGAVTPWGWVLLVSAALLSVAAIALIPLWQWRHLLQRSRSSDAHAFPILPSNTNETKD